MVKCKVEEHHTALLVTFEDGKTLLIQDAYEQEVFKTDCMCDEIEDIDECFSEYYELAE